MTILYEYLLSTGLDGWIWPLWSRTCLFAMFHTSDRAGITIYTSLYIYIVVWCQFSYSWLTNRRGRIMDLGGTSLKKVTFSDIYIYHSTGSCGNSWRNGKMKFYWDLSWLKSIKELWPQQKDWSFWMGLNGQRL